MIQYIAADQSSATANPASIGMFSGPRSSILVESLFFSMQNSSSKFYEPRLPTTGPHTVSPLDPSRIEWRNGLIVRAPNWLGDTLMCMPAVKALRAFLPKGCGLFIACSEALAPVWEAAPWVDAIGPFTGSRIRGDALGRLRSLGAGVGLVLPNSFGSALDLYRLGPPVRVGRRGNGRRLLLTYALSPWHKSECRGFHQLCHYLELAAAFGAIDTVGLAAGLQVNGVREVAVRLGIHRGEKTPWLVLAPGAAFGPAKQWPGKAFRAVAVEWTKRGGRVAGIGTDKEHLLTEEILDGIPGALNLAGRTSLGELMAVLSTVDAVVANDSGAMHLAAALGTSGVAVFGSTDPIATGPLGGRWIVLREDFPCAPCFGRTCTLPEADYRCLHAISPADVLKALESLGASNLQTD